LQPAKELVKDDSLAWIAEEEANRVTKTIQKFIAFRERISLIDQYYGESELSGQLQVLKNKVI
jgi:hypothetical protein